MLSVYNHTRCDLIDACGILCLCIDLTTHQYDVIAAGHYFFPIGKRSPLRFKHLTAQPMYMAYVKF